MYPLPARIGAVFPRFTVKPAILCLNCNQFNRDVSELLAHGQRYQYLVLPDTELSRGQPWIPQPMREQSSYVNFKGPDVDRLWDKSRRFGHSVIENARASSPNLVAVLAGNWDYWNEECIRLACADLGLPFLVLLRESFLNTYGLQENIDYFSMWSRIPQPDAIAVAGEATATLFGKLNLFAKAPLIPTGWPRLDVWRRAANPRMDRPVVLMSYFKGYYADQHFMDMLVTFDDLAKQYPDIPFVVKAKHRVQQEELAEAVRARGLSLPVIDLMNLPSLLCNARVVIGYNSMIMFEALLSPAHLVIPYWGETAQNPDALAPSPRDERLKEHVVFATSENSLRETVAAAIAGRVPAPDLGKRTQVFGQYFTYTPDRSSVERVEDFIDASLQSTP